MNKGRVKVYRVPGPGPSTGGEDFSSEKIGGRRLFFRKNRGAKTFFRLKKVGEDFFSGKFFLNFSQNPVNFDWSLRSFYSAK